MRATIRRMPRLVLIPLAMLCAAAMPADADEAFYRTSQPCNVEMLEQARAACLAHLADQQAMEMEARIGDRLSTLQGASARTLAALRRRYAQARDLWLAEVIRGCRDAFPEDPAGYQRCRLAATLSRRTQLEESLARAAADLGGPPPSPVPMPRAVEVLVPLTPPAGADGSEVRVPLWVPVLP